MTMQQIVATVLSASSLVFASGLVCAAGQYGPGVSDAEIEIGNAMPYSGPASALGATGKSEAAYFSTLNISSTSSCSTSLRTTSTVFGGL